MLVISMGALLPVSAATGSKLQLEALLVFHLMDYCLMIGDIAMSYDDTPIDNENFAPNTKTTELDALTNYVVTLDRLMDCDI